MQNNDTEQLYYLFERVIKLKFNRAFVLCDDIGIHPGQNHMLSFLYKHEGQSQKQIADMINIKPSTVTIMIKKMEKANLVKRIPDEMDQRVIRVYLSDEGRIICEKLLEVNNQIQEECLKDFDEKEIEELHKLLSKVKNNLEQFEDEKLFKEKMQKHMECHHGVKEDDN